MEHTLARIIVRRYPPRRETASWHPQYHDTAYRRIGGGMAGLAPTSYSRQGPFYERISWWSRLSGNDDIRHFAGTFTIAFVGILILFN